MRAECFRISEAPGIADRDDVCEGGHWTDAVDAARGVRAPGRRGQGSIQCLPSCSHTLPNPQQRLDGRRQIRQNAHFEQLEHPSSEAIAVDCPDLETVNLEQPSNGACIRAMSVVRIDCGVCDLAPLSVNRGVDRLVQRRGRERRQALPARSARVAEWPFWKAYPAVAFGGRDWILISQLCDLAEYKRG